MLDVKKQSAVATVTVKVIPKVMRSPLPRHCETRVYRGTLQFQNPLNGIKSPLDFIEIRGGRQ